MAKITKHGGPSDASADTVITGVEPSVPANVESEDVHAEPVETPFEPEPEPIPDAEPTGLYSFDAPSTPTTSTGRRRR